MSERRFGRAPGRVCPLSLHLACPEYRFRIEGELLEKIATELGWQIVATGVMPDQRHLVARVGPTGAPAQVVRAVQGLTARVLRQEFPHLRWFAKVLWSPSYLAARVSDVLESTVRGCIVHQWDVVVS